MMFTLTIIAGFVWMIFIHSLVKEAEVGALTEETNE